MSLFKLKSLWSKTFANEEFDEKHLAFGAIGKQPAIALANFKGALHVFLVSAAQPLEVTTIYQNNFQSGVVAVQFVAHPDERIRSKTIGVLLFRKFTFVTLQNNGRDSYEAKLMSVEIEPSFGIGVGPLSVMTLNSSIQTLNPRQIHKIKVADPIYPFAQLLSKLYYMDGEELVQLDGSTEQWRIIVGRARQLFAFVDTVLVVGEKAIWEVSQARIIKTKVVEEEISCGAIAFLNHSPSTYNILIANFTAQLFLYSSSYQLLWAIKLDYVPLKLFVCQHPELKGMLVLLSEQGCLELGYSGVQMPEHVVQPLSQKIDFGRVEQETLELLARGNDKAEQKSMAKANQEKKYNLFFGELEKSYEAHEEKSRLFQIEGKLVKYQLQCEVSSGQTLRNFRVQITPPCNLWCAQDTKELKAAKHKDRLVFTLFASNQLYPYQREMHVVVRYDNNEQSGTPFIGSETVALPMGLQCLIAGFQTKDTFENKIIIKSNLQLPSFNQTFPELLNSSAQQRKSVKFRLANGVECTVGYNKGLNKAKIESPYYSGLCYTISEFANHIRSYNKKTNSKIELSVQIPLEQFFAIMKQHYEHRQRLKKAFKEVQLKSEQFRNTQKKLLLRMKEKMSSLGNIDKLLEFTYDRLIDRASNYEQCSQQMDVINHNLSVAITLVIELLFVRANPSDKAKHIALGILGYERESLQRGWEDKVMANSAHFLNKKFNKGDQVSFQQLQKIPLYVISKVNNGDWN